MANLKAPCLSLDARGSVGEAISFTERRGQKIAEKKPVLPYIKSLPLQYQRWLYQDYAFEWTLRSQAVKAVYRSAGTRFHLTAFQYWMKYNLLNLPDIVGMWHLDARSDAIVPDKSRNSNHGVNIGAVPATGFIDGCLYFDGINNYVEVPDSASLRLTDAITIHAIIKPDSLADTQGIVEKGTFAGAWGDFSLTVRNDNKFSFAFNNGAVGFQSAYSIGLEWADVFATYDKTKMRLFFNGVLDANSFATAVSIDTSATALRIGEYFNATFRFKGLIDHVYILNRALTPAEITFRTSPERRWPQ